MSKLKASVFGLGYVGSVTAVCFADKGWQVIGVESNPEKQVLFRSGKSPLFEPGLDVLLKKVFNARLFCIKNTQEAISNSEVSFVCVGTPSKKNGHPDTGYLERVCREIGEALRLKKTSHTIVIRSTTLPNTIENLIIPILEKTSNKKEGKEFHVVSNPEFIREGCAIRDFYDPPFIVIGEHNKEAGDIVSKMYEGIDSQQIRVCMNVAETIKFACNAFHSAKITFANEIGQFCKAFGIDSQKVMEILCKDTKLNISNAYLAPGLAYGGSCLPKDLRALTNRSRDEGLELPMLEAITRSNLNQIQSTINFISEFEYRDIGILGLSFKADTDDLRESPVVLLSEALIGKGFKVSIHDSDVELTRLIGANRQFLEEKLPHIASLLVTKVEDVIKKCKILIICKKHRDYTDLRNRVSEEHVIVDLVGAAKGIDFFKKNYHGLYW